MNYIIFDLEATCWQDRKGDNEIIEIGAVKYNDKLEKIDTFSKFVRPTSNPVLSGFCKNLTTITQEQVDGADKFEITISEFSDWVLKDSDDYMILSWGAYDKKQILRESKSKNYIGDISSVLDSHVNIKAKFAELKGIKPCGMNKALRLLNLKLEGTHHRGIDDAINIGKIFEKIKGEM